MMHGQSKSIALLVAALAAGCNQQPISADKYAKTVTVSISAPAQFRVTTDIDSTAYEFQPEEFFYKFQKIPTLSKDAQFVIVADRDVPSSFVMLAQQHLYDSGATKVDVVQSNVGTELILVVVHDSDECRISGFLWRESSRFPCSELIATLAKSYPNKAQTNVSIISFGNRTPERAKELETEVASAGYLMNRDRSIEVGFITEPPPKDPSVKDQ